jgi:hypothetical protein
MLAYRGAVLDAIVVGDVHRRGCAMSRILGTNPRNIIRASARRARSRFSIHRRRKRSDIIPVETVERVTEWWEQEMRVSPMMKDTRQRPGGGIVQSHPIHLLLETQV